MLLLCLSLQLCECPQSCCAHTVPAQLNGTTDPSAEPERARSLAHGCTQVLACLVLTLAQALRLLLLPLSLYPKMLRGSDPKQGMPVPLLPHLGCLVPRRGRGRRPHSPAAARMGPRALARAPRLLRMPMTRPFWPAVPVQAECDTGGSGHGCSSGSFVLWGSSHLHLPLPSFLSQSPVCACPPPRPLTA